MYMFRITFPETDPICPNRVKVVRYFKLETAEYYVDYYNDWYCKIERLKLA